MTDATRGGSGRGFFEEIGLHVPGFKGYLRKELRRDADKAQREFLVGELKKLKGRVDVVKRDLAVAGKLSALTRLESVTDKFSTIITRVGAADYGYSGFFDANQVDETRLDLLYQVDMALIEEAKAVETAVGPISADQEESDLLATLRAIEDKIVHFGTQFDKRRQILKGEM